MGQKFGHPTASPTGDSIFFNRDKTAVMFDQRENQGLVQRLDPAHINHGRVDSVTRQYGLIQQNTKVENGNLGALAHDIALYRA